MEYTARNIRDLMPALLDRPVSEIGDAEIFAFRNARAREGRRIIETVKVGDKTERRERRGPAKPSTINRDLRTLRAALKKVRPDYRCPGGAFFREDETRVRWLRPEEEILVLEPMPSPFREIAKLAALTLMRQGEIRTLRREYVHLEQGVILLPQAKAGARPVIMSDAARKIVCAQLEAHGSEWVFPGPRTVGPTAASRSERCSAASRAVQDSRTSISTTSDTTARRWRSTAALRLRS